MAHISERERIAMRIDRQIIEAKSVIEQMEKLNENALSRNQMFNIQNALKSLIHFASLCGIQPVVEPYTCGECGSKTTKVGAWWFCNKLGCSMYGRSQQEK